MAAHTQYAMFNPYVHLTRSFRVEPRQWVYLYEHELGAQDMRVLRRGGVVHLGKAARLWKVDVSR